MAAFGEQNLSRKSLLEFAQSQAATGRTARSTRSIRRVSARSTSMSSPRSIPSGSGSTGCTRATARCSRRVYPVLTNLSDYVDHAIDPATGLVTNLPSTSIYYDFPTVTRINVLGVNVFRRVGEIATTPSPPRTGDLAPALAAIVADDRDQRQAHASRRHVRRRTAREPHAGRPRPRRRRTRARSYYGVVPAAKVAAVGKYIASLGLTAPPRTAGEVIGALAMAGLDDDLVNRLTDKHIRRVGEHPRPRRHLHVGGVAALRHHRRQHVARVGRERARRDPTRAARRHARRRGVRVIHRRAADDRARPRNRHRPDAGRRDRGRLGASRTRPKPRSRWTSRCPRTRRPPCASRPRTSRQISEGGQALAHTAGVTFVEDRRQRRGAPSRRAAHTTSPSRAERPRPRQSPSRSANRFANR